MKINKRFFKPSIEVMSPRSSQKFNVITKFVFFKLKRQLHLVWLEEQRLLPVMSPVHLAPYRSFVRYNYCKSHFVMINSFHSMHPEKLQLTQLTNQSILYVRLSFYCQN